MIKYKLQIDDKILELDHEITDVGIQNLCKAHNAKFIGIRTSQYYRWLQQVTDITYILKKDETKMPPL